ncbi:FAD-dependent monooxygenase [Microbacterium sp. ASV49]|uniref:FAD-dependent monooxygenase n=1 Tax=Microbacterium candidum TaxID=3041922 RepID=A0ABT7N3Q6_9MICO|nr:FAD-dependent monooxygenase [Microbacterium sp. ASV49]MDL9981335.1 FAD-dependent monooxygenase [Microbacterium sp. ASV49]
MQKYRILIVGAGIAGAAAAAFLGRSGHDVTLVERSVGARSSGSPVDVRGTALEAARALGVEDALRARDTGARTLAIVDGRGRTVTTIGMRPAPEDIEIARVELAAVLAGAARDVADIRFDATFSLLEPHDDGVDVTFVDGREGRFDAVIGADGQHSATRRALWGSAAAVRPIGLAIATIPLDFEIDDPTVVRMHNEPGVSLTVHPAGGHPGVAFIFRCAAVPAGRDEQEGLLRTRYASTGWRAAEFLAALGDAPDMYFDGVERVTSSSWSRGRVALLGDAASSLTILGNGSSTALAGARVLDRAFADSESVEAAFVRYERLQRPSIERAQRGAAAGAAFLVPKTTAGISVRNAAARVMRTV